SGHDRTVHRPDQPVLAALDRSRGEGALRREPGSDLGLEVGDVTVQLLLVPADPVEHLALLRPGADQLPLAVVERAAGPLELGLLRGDRVSGRLDPVAYGAQAVDDRAGLVAEVADPPDQSLVLVVEIAQVGGARD